MTGFIIAAAVIVVLALLVLLRNAIWRRQRPAQTHRQINAAVYREQLEKLEQDLKVGLLSEEDHAQAKTELQRRIIDEEEQEESGAQLRAPKATIAAIVVLVPVLAVGLYLYLGSPAALNPNAQPEQPTLQDVNKMVETLAKRLEQNPNDPQGWAMLARSYKVLGRSQEAERAFEKAGPAIEGDAQLLAIYADLAASNANGRFEGKPLELINKALKIDPDNAMALWLQGSAAFNSADFKGAIRAWEHVAKTLPAGSEDLQTLQGALNEAYAKIGKTAPTLAGGAPAAQEAPAGAAGAPAPQQAQAQAGGKASAQGSVSGKVDLDPALIAKVTPDDTVMVIARAPGSRMPVAVLRKKALDLPLQFSLDDSLAMGPMTRISTVDKVEIEARISKSGMAQPESGDLISAVQTVTVGAKGVQLHVNKVRP